MLKIVRHLERGGDDDPFDPRTPSALPAPVRSLRSLSFAERAGFLAWNEKLTGAFPLNFQKERYTPAALYQPSSRAAFVIDKEGIVGDAEQTPTPKDLPNFAAIKGVLKSLKLPLSAQEIRLGGGSSRPLFQKKCC